MQPLFRLLRSPLAMGLLLASLACESRLSEAAKAAQASAQAADSRVQALQAELDELRKSRPQGDQLHIHNAQQKALEKLVADARRRALARHQEAESLAKAPATAGRTPKPVVVEVPAGSPLNVRLVKDLSTETAHPGDGWAGTLASPVTVEGRLVWPEGTEVRGVVTQSTPAGRLQSGQGSLGIRLTEVGTADVEAGTHVVVGDARVERNTKFIAGGAALGALAGILGDRKNRPDHALGGAALGAAAGTALAAGTADTVIRIPAARPILFTLKASEKVTLSR